MLKKAIRKTNYYFIGDEEISLSDSIWFYGFYGVVILVAVSIFVSGVMM